jgi:hypothetical protein
MPRLPILKILASVALGFLPCAEHAAEQRAIPNSNRPPNAPGGPSAAERRSRPGPWDNDVTVHRVTPDGRVERLATFERAGVPTVARLRDGRIIAAHQYFPENDDANFDKVAVRFSSDEGHTWTTPDVLKLDGLPDGMRYPFDPTLVPLPDGRVRLYFTSLKGRRFEEAMPAIYSAISSNGVHYTFESGQRFGIEGRTVIDCAVVLHQGIFHLYSPDNGFGGPRPPGAQPENVRPEDAAGLGTGYHALSQDGLNFTRQPDVKITGRRRWLGNAQSDGQTITFYGTGESGGPGQPGGGVWLATSQDGQNWRLAENRGRIPGADPGAVNLRDGSLLVVATGGPRPGTLSAERRPQNQPQREPFEGGPNPNQRGPGNRGNAGRPQGQEGGFQPLPQGLGAPMHPLVRALDLDGDGEISAAEIEKASSSLKKADLNQDGKLSGDELRPPRPGGGPGQPQNFRPQQSQMEDGPWNHRILLATSKDGLAWTIRDEILAERASVPELFTGPDGRPVMLFVDAGEGRGGLSALVQKADGTWERRATNLRGADPNVVQLQDKSYRAYTKTGNDGLIMAFGSLDGLTWESLGTAFHDEGYPQATDSDVFQTPENWVMLISLGSRLLRCTSSDGLRFTESERLNLGGSVSDTVKVPGGWRTFFHVNASPLTGNKMLIRSAFTADGRAWKIEDGDRVVSPSQGPARFGVADPAPLQLPDGSWLMALKSFIEAPARPGQQPGFRGSGQPGPPPEPRR